MQVEHVKNVVPGHTIELGKATWDLASARSIRDRWDGPNGHFSPHASSEIPLESLVPLLEFAAEKNELSVSECAQIMVALAESIKRQQASSQT